MSRDEALQKPESTTPSAVSQDREVLVDTAADEIAVAQIYPVVFGVVSPTDSQAVSAYASLNAAFPSWDTFQFHDSFPWAIVGYAATLMGDANRANQYRTSVESKFVNVTPQFPYPWYDGEDGWFMRMVALQDKGGSS